MTLIPNVSFGSKEPWQEFALSSIASLIKDGTHGTHKDCPSGSHLLLSAKNITDGVVSFDETDRRISEDEYNSIYKNYALKAGDLLLTVVGTVGRVALFTEEIHHVAFQRSVAFLRFDGQSPEFFKQLFLSERFQKSLFSKQVQSAQAGVYLGDLAKIKVRIPSLKEQQKIASFLNAIDSRIDQLTQKHALLVEYKRGVIQEVMFKDVDGRKFPEWRKVAVGELGEFSGGGTPSKSVESYWQGNIPWISSSDVDEDFCTRPNVQKFISAEALKESPTKIIPSGSILIVSRVGVGKIAIAETEICTSQDFTNLTLKNDDANYVGNWLHFNSEKIRALSQGTSIKGVTTDDLKGLIIDLPSVAEQKKIADLIKSLDALIAKETSSIHELKAYKQGLLQAMFI
jgi:type I restriction enzyme S subunit